MLLHISGTSANHGTTRRIRPTDANTPYSPDYSALTTSASSYSPADFTDNSIATLTTTYSTSSPTAAKSKLTPDGRHETTNTSPSYSTNTLPINQATDAASTFASDNAGDLQPAEHTKSYVRYGSTVSPKNVLSSASTLEMNKQSKAVVEPNGNLPMKYTSTERYSNITDDMIIGFNRINHTKLLNETSPAKRRNDDGK